MADFMRRRKRGYYHQSNKQEGAQSNEASKKIMVKAVVRVSVLLLVAGIEENSTKLEIRVVAMRVMALVRRGGGVVANNSAALGAEVVVTVVVVAVAAGGGGGEEEEKHANVPRGSSFLQQNV